MKQKLQIIFDVAELYYLPQYLPIHDEFTRRGCGQTRFVFYRGKDDAIIENIVQQENLNHIWVDNTFNASQYYQQQKADWVFFSNSFPFLKALHKVSKSVQIGHGIGAKSSYYKQSDTPTTLRLVEGQYKTKRLKSMYPNSTFIDVGFCKLDPIINGCVAGFDLTDLGLDKNKKTILYAPTFYPSSLEKFSKKFPHDFQEFNIIIKPHHFSLRDKKYKKQRQLLECWAQYDNVYSAKIDDYSLVPFMATADLLISDTSSAIIEFAALNKPVIWCDFLQLRWSYRGVFSYRFKNRMDKDYHEYTKIAVRSDCYKALKTHVIEQIKNPQALSDQRCHYAHKMAGTLDGKSSQRVIDYLLIHN